MCRLAFFTLCLLACISARAELQVSAFFSDHMVLQRGQDLPVWGQASPGARIEVSFKNSSATAIADASGRWTAELPPQKVGEPGTLSIQSGDTNLEFNNVVVGEVWICSGQSNMQWPVRRANHAKAEIAAADFPAIRLFEVPNRYSVAPETDLEASWQVCSPATVGNFSAVAYYFGRELWQELGVPVGLVSSNWGGTPAEAWTPLSALQARPEFADLVTSYEEAVAQLTTEPDMEARMQSQFDAFTERANALSENPPAPDAAWFDPAAVYPDALPVEPNTPFLAETDGLVHVRKVIALTAEEAARTGARLQLGEIDNFDVAWVNGQRVGSTLLNEPDRDARSAARDYAVPDGVLREEENVLLLQIVDVRRIADFGRNVDAPAIVWPNGERLLLKSGWKMQIVEDIGARPDTLEAKMKDIGSFLWNGMVAPLTPAAFRGVIWYQGESNAERAEQYRLLFPDMIRAWRASWGRGDFPFYFVQLANFDNQPGWPELREAQRETLSLPHTGMAVTIDIGDPQDIHPRNKQDVGRRLALWALADTYGVSEPTGPLGRWPLIGQLFQRPMPHSGPLFSHAWWTGNDVRLHFDHVYEGLQGLGGMPLKGFELAGEDGVFAEASATIEGDTIIVTRSGLRHPAGVRYAWHINPNGNLTNSTGLPASPFKAERPKTPMKP